ncbi:MAG: hypothetical protein V4645_16125 [Pseudomonadota bacterium]
MDRQPRAAWMRLLPWLRLYRCSSCSKMHLLSKQKVDNARLLHAAQVRARGG